MEALFSRVGPPLALVAMLAFSGCAYSPYGNSYGYGRGGAQTVCHSGRTLSVGRHAAGDHIRHGDRAGSCSSRGYYGGGRAQSRGHSDRDHHDRARDARDHNGRDRHGRGRGHGNGRHH